MASSRRALLATVLAAAGTAAATGPALTLHPNADAEIIALSNAIMAGFEESQRLSRIEDELGDAAENQQRRRDIRAQQHVLSDKGWDMRARLAALRPVTQAGLQAKARMVREFSNAGEGDSAYMDESLAWSLANDVLGVPSKFSESDGGEADKTADAPGLAEVPQSPDAELIAMCEEYIALDFRYLALADANANLPFDDPASLMIDEEIDSVTPRFRELQDELADREAVTLAGALALARAARHDLSADARDGAVALPPEGGLAWAAIESLLAMLGDKKVVASAPRDCPAGRAPGLVHDVPGASMMALSDWRPWSGRGSLPRMTTPNLYRGFRFPAEVIEHAVWLYHSFSLSLRDVETILAARGIVVSYESIRNWGLRFGQMFANALQRRRPRSGDKGFLDEVFIRIHNHFQLRRHRLTSTAYRTARDAAFRTWREVTGVAAAA